MIKNAVKAEMDRRGWNVLKLSTESGVSNPALYDWFADKREIGSDKVEKLLATLSLHVTRNRGK